MPEPSIKRLIRDSRRILGHPFWIPELYSDTMYSRLHDDHDGTREGIVSVKFDMAGDAWLSTDKHRGPPLRFRTEGGGGLSPRVRNALMLLAEAIRLDNLEHPAGDPLRTS